MATEDRVYISFHFEHSSEYLELYTFKTSKDRNTKFYS